MVLCGGKKFRKLHNPRISNILSFAKLEWMEFTGECWGYNQWVAVFFCKTVKILVLRIFSILRMSTNVLLRCAFYRISDFRNLHFIGILRLHFCILSDFRYFYFVFGRIPRLGFVFISDICKVSLFSWTAYPIKAYLFSGVFWAIIWPFVQIGLDKVNKKRQEKK